MIYVGIDIAKLNHFASILSSSGEVLVEPFKFSNDAESFRSLSSIVSNGITSSSVLNQRPTKTITFLSSFSPKSSDSVSGISLKRLLYGTTMFDELRSIGLTPF